MLPIFAAILQGMAGQAAGEGLGSMTGNMVGKSIASNMGQASANMLQQIVPDSVSQQVATPPPIVGQMPVFDTKGPDKEKQMLRRLALASIQNFNRPTY